jgi:hypothetical protein
VLAESTAQRYCAGPSELSFRSPRSSFGHGAAGIAYYLSRQGRTTEAAEWLAFAEAAIDEPGAFTGDPPVFPNRRTAPPTSVLFGEAGVWWVTLLMRSDTRAVDRFCAIAATCPDSRLDVASGAAGLLLATAAIVDRAPERLIPLGDDLARRLAAAPVTLDWLGAAHGWAGIAYAQLRWCQATATAPGPALLTLLDSLREARGRKGAWPRRPDSDELWTGWCHGSAGWVHLWLLARDVLGDDSLLALAEPPAVHALLAGGAAASLCCGLAGEAYAGVAMYRATGEPTWLTHARRLAAEAATVPVGPTFPAHSLWGGDLGVAVLALDLEEPQRAAMPLYG